MAVSREDERKKRKAKKKALKGKKRQINKKRALRDKDRQSEKKKYRTLIKSNRKEMEKYLGQSNIDLVSLKKLFRQAQKNLDTAAQKGVIHKKRAAKKKSKYSQKISNLEKKASLDNPTPIE